MDMSKFTNSMNAFTSDCFNPDLFKQHQLASQSVKKIFKDGSFIDLLISPIPLFALTCLNRKTDHGNLIDAELNRFKKTEWAESPFLDVFYLLYCKNPAILATIAACWIAPINSNAFARYIAASMKANHKSIQ